MSIFFRAAAMTLRTVLLSLQALLAAAEPDDPQDAVVAKQYKEDPEMFRLTARHWAQAYAGGCINFPIFIITLVVNSFILFVIFLHIILFVRIRVNLSNYTLCYKSVENNCVR